MESEQTAIKNSPAIDALANEMRPAAYLEMDTSRMLVEEAFRKFRSCNGGGVPELELRAESAKSSLNTDFDPSEAVKNIREIANGAVNGDEKAVRSLGDELQKMSKASGLQDIVLDQLARPDATRKLPVATVDIDPKTKAITSVTFEPGCLDGRRKASAVTYFGAPR